LCTPFDRGSADLLEEIGVVAFKVPSGELDNLPFLADLAGRGRPLLISTGMADEDEVAAALAACEAAPGVCVLHCVSAYPAPIDAANLRVIPALAARFGVPVGWSDHTLGDETALAAVALGASLLERHLTLDRTRPGPDHAASAEPDELAGYVAGVRRVESALGDEHKRPQPIELENRRLVRRSVHAAVALQPGDTLDGANTIVVRPAGGLPPSTDLDALVVVRAVPAGSPVTQADVAPRSVR
jgi:N-acetylneuraminate synthase/N,N'-diacetyllegionaminate synthase